MQEPVKREKGKEIPDEENRGKEGKQNRFNVGREKGEELHYFTQSSVTSRGHCRVVLPHNCRTAPGIAHPAAHTSHELLDFL